MENCIVRGTSPVDGRESTEDAIETSWKGLYVAPNAEAILKQCIFTKFDVGIRVRAAGRLHMSFGSEITACNIGILVRKIQLSHSSITNVDYHNRPSRVLISRS